MQIKAIGYVRSPFASPEECPRQGRQDMPPCIIDMEQEFVPGLHRLVPGQKIVVLTWMHLARRDLFRCRPRNSPARPIHGVFATRSPNRPNPIGLHEVRILEISRNRLKVHPLEAVDRTPVLDIKPLLGSPGFSGQIRDFFSLEDMNALMEAARQGWLRGFVQRSQRQPESAQGEYRAHHPLRNIQGLPHSR